MWFCTTCGEYLLSGPTNIQNYCFDHMCTDLEEANVAERMDKVIEVVSAVRKNVIDPAPDSSWDRIQWIQSICSSMLFFSLLIFFVWYSHSNSSQGISNPSNPYEAAGSTHWIFLLTFGSMVANLG